MSGDVAKILTYAGVAIAAGVMAVLGYWKRRANTADAKNVQLEQKVDHDEHVVAVQKMEPDEVSKSIDQLTDPKPDGTGGSTGNNN